MTHDVPSPPHGDPPAPPDLERRRLRAPLLVVAVGLPLAFALAVGTSLLGMPGVVGGAVFLTLASLVVGIAGVVVAVGLVVDQVRGHPTPGRRILLAGGLMLVTLLLLIGSAGATVQAARGGL